MAALVALVARDGIARVYDGRHSVVFPGVVARVDGQEGWVAGADALRTAGLRFRVEDADAAAYWAILAEGLLGLRAFGVSDIAVGMSEEEFERIGREVGALIKAQCGGKVSIRHGDHFALFALEPWSRGGKPDASQRTVILRIGAQRAQAIVLEGERVVEQLILQHSWDEAVVRPAVERAFREGRRRDMHEETWELFSSSAGDNALLSGFAEAVLNQASSTGWTGQLVVSGAAGETLLKALRQSFTRSSMPMELVLADEAVGLWNLVA